MSRTRNRINVDLGDQHQAWLNMAEKYQQRPTTLARACLINILMGEKAAHPEITSTIIKSRHAAKGEGHLHSLNLRPDELQALDHYAKMLGVNRHQALRYIVREFTAREPHFTSEERIELGRSNVYLSRCCTNLNQMAKKINSLARDEVRFGDLKFLTEQVREQCKELKDKMLLHTGTVWDLINAVRNRLAVNEP